MTQEQLLERWALLVAELPRWCQSLPASFTPSARTNVMGFDDSLMSDSMSRFEQIWYDAPICAGTMQSYHMAAILLLVNQPQESTAIRNTVSARLHSCRRGEREALLHARDICGMNQWLPSYLHKNTDVKTLWWYTTSSDFHLFKTSVQNRGKLGPSSATDFLPLLPPYQRSVSLICHPRRFRTL